MSKITLKQFMKKAGILDSMAGGFWYNIYLASGLSLEEFFRITKGKENKKGKK
jgi:hypothetical protein